MDREDRNAVMNQLTSYDRFISAATVASLNRTFAVVAVPPKAPSTQEKWVAVSAVEGVIDPSIRQPDPERKAICGHYKYCLCYWYADELPRCMVLAVVFAVILSILTTPLVLLCCVPMICRMKKVSIKCSANKQLEASEGIMSKDSSFISWHTLLVSVLSNLCLN